MVLDASQWQPGNYAGFGEMPCRTQYRSAATHRYVYAGRPGSEFKEFGSEIKFFPGAVSFQIIFLG